MPIQLYITGLGKQSAMLAGEIGDGFGKCGYQQAFECK